MSDCLSAMNRWIATSAEGRKDQFAAGGSSRCPECRCRSTPTVPAYVSSTSHTSRSGGRDRGTAMTGPLPERSRGCLCGPAHPGKADSDRPKSRAEPSQSGFGNFVVRTSPSLA